MTAAWTNTGGPPQADVGQVHVAGNGKSLLRLASADERLALARCAAGVDKSWAPGKWVKLKGDACQL